MEPLSESRGQPRCAKCRGPLAAEDLSVMFRLLAAAVAVVAVALALSPSHPRDWGARYAGGAAGAVLALVLMRSRRHWRCVSCGACFRRVRPARRCIGSEAAGGPGKGNAGAPRGTDSDTVVG